MCSGTFTPTRRASRCTITIPRSKALRRRSFFSCSFASTDCPLATPAAHRPVDLSLGLSFLDALTTIPVRLATAQPKLHLGAPLLEVKGQRNDGITSFAHLCSP